MIRKIVTAAGSCITVLAVLSVSVVTNELTYDTPVSGVVQIVNLHSEQDRNTDSFKVLATKTAMLPIDSKIADDVSAGDFIEANVTSSKVIEKNEGPVVGEVTRIKSKTVGQGHVPVQGEMDGTHEVYLIPASRTHVPTPDEYISQAGLNNFANYWNTQSGGKLTVNVHLMPAIQYEDPAPGTCLTDPFWQTYSWNAAYAKASETMTLPPSAYNQWPDDYKNHIVFQFADQDCYGIDWAGVSATPANWIVLASLKGSLSGSVDVLTHEFGHNLGLLHSKSLTLCPDRFRPSPREECSNNEYGDSEGPMGWSTSGYEQVQHGSLNAVELDQLGWTKTVSINPNSDTDTFTIADIRNVEGVRAVKIPLTGAGGPPEDSYIGMHLYIEYRPQLGINNRSDAGLDATNGIRLRVLTVGGCCCG